MQRLVVDRVVHIKHEVLALTHIRDSRYPEPRKRTRDGLPLRVEDLSFGHHVHHDLYHVVKRTANIVAPIR